jgi:hypothetical protein
LGGGVVGGGGGGGSLEPWPSWSRNLLAAGRQAKLGPVAGFGFLFIFVISLNPINELKFQIP